MHGVPRTTYLPAPFQIVQSPGSLAMVYQDNHSFRIVYSDKKPHIEGIDYWMGDSRGHWDGNTFVVDVTSLNADTWFDAAGNHHGDNMHVVERYTMTGPKTMQYEAKIDDPDTFTRTWTIRLTLDRAKPGTRIIEDECLDDENGIRHRISPDDPRSLQHNDYSRWDKLAANVPHESLALPADPPIEEIKPGPNLPRLPDGHPDLNGLWMRVMSFGGARGAGGRGASTSLDLGGLAARTPPPGSDDSGDFKSAGVPKVPYTAAGFLEMEWRGMHDFLDGEPRCHLAGVPRAAQQPPDPHQIIQDDGYFTILYEYVHEPRIIPIDGSSHPKNYWAWDGDSRAHWDGDTLVVDFANSNGRTWLDMMGNFVDENEHVVERYTLIDVDTMNYEATITDPVIFSKSWTMHFIVKRQPDTNQVLEHACVEGEQDRQHYTEEYGGSAGLAVKNGEVLQTPRNIDATASAGTAEAIVKGCLRPSPNGADDAYLVDTDSVGTVRVTVNQNITSVVPPLLFRDVRFRGTWENEQSNNKRFKASAVRVLAEGCTSNGR